MARPPSRRICWSCCSKSRARAGETGWARKSATRSWRRCRAESATVWSMGDAEDLLARYGWYFTNSSNRSHPVGSLRPNDWGLFDVHGNALEWCHDQLGEKEDIKDKEEIKDQYNRYIRGG